MPQVHDDFKLSSRFHSGRESVMIGVTMSVWDPRLAGTSKYVTSKVMSCSCTFPSSLAPLTIVSFTELLSTLRLAVTDWRDY
jgi:hypothetical protein